MKKKKTLIAIGTLLLVAVVGATFAYYTSNTTFENVFNAGKYKITLTEEFESPDNWVPGETIPKTVTAKNDGTVPAAVRVSYVEKWEDLEGNDITSQVTPNPAIINFDNTSDWIQDGNHYYYKYILEPNDTTSSFISGVTLDPNLNSVTCTGEGNTKTCEAQNPASGAKYKLTFTIETIQYDQYQNVWDTDVEIKEYTDAVTFVTRQVENQITPGDVVGIGETEDFFVVSSNPEKTVLLAKYNLMVGNFFGERQMPGTGLQSEAAISGYTWAGEHFVRYGSVGFSSTNYWNDEDNGLKASYAKDKDGNNASYDGNPYPYVYDNTITGEPDFSNPDWDNETNWWRTAGYSIAYYVEGYKNVLIGMGAPSTISTRLLSYEEANNARNVSSTDVSSIIFYNGMSYWLGSSDNGWDVMVVKGDYDEFGSESYYNADYGVRMVIEIPTSELQ